MVHRVIFDIKIDISFLRLSLNRRSGDSHAPLPRLFTTLPKKVKPNPNSRSQSPVILKPLRQDHGSTWNGRFIETAVAPTETEWKNEGAPRYSFNVYCCCSSAARASPMSLPVVLPGSCCRLSGAVLAHQLADAPYRTRSRCVSALPSRMSGPQTRLIPAVLPARPLLSIGLLQLVLGCSMVALSFGALSLSNSPPIRNSCPFWAGSSVSIKLLAMRCQCIYFILHVDLQIYIYCSLLLICYE